jgi:hypothetical protein
MASTRSYFLEPTAGFHGTAGNKNRRYVKPHRRHEHARSDFSQLKCRPWRQPYARCTYIQHYRQSDRVKEVIQHSGMTHGNTIIHLSIELSITAFIFMMALTSCRSYENVTGTN